MLSNDYASGRMLERIFCSSVSLAKTASFLSAALILAELRPYRAGRNWGLSGRVALGRSVVLVIEGRRHVGIIFVDILLFLLLSVLVFVEVLLPRFFFQHIQLLFPGAFMAHPPVIALAAQRIRVIG
jgi:hypothetical protein